MKEPFSAGERGVNGVKRLSRSERKGFPGVEREGGPSGKEEEG